MMNYNNLRKLKIFDSISKKGEEIYLENMKNRYKKSNFDGPYEIVENTGKDVFDILFSNLSELDILEKGEDFKYDKEYMLKEMFVRASCGTDIIKWNKLQRCWVNLPKEVKKKVKKEVKEKPEFLYDSNGQKTHKLNKLYNSYRVIEK